MSHSSPLAPSLDPSGTVYLVLDDFGPLGRAGMVVLATEDVMRGGKCQPP